jgi:hypothetical protein
MLISWHASHDAELQPKAKSMAGEIKPIKDEFLIEMFKEICKPDEPWSAEKHCLALWTLFRKRGFLKGASPEEIKKAAAQWQADYANGHFGYASNQAKHCEATPGVCRPNIKVAAMAEFK